MLLPVTRVFVANGALDRDVLTGSTLLAIQKMIFNGQMGFRSKRSKPIDIQLTVKRFHHLFKEQDFGPPSALQGIMGVQHYDMGLNVCEDRSEWPHRAAVSAEESLKTLAVPVGKH